MNKNTKIFIIFLVLLLIIGLTLQIIFPEEKPIAPINNQIPVVQDSRATKINSEENPGVADQGLLDIEFNEALIRKIDKFPWYQDFPIVTDEFTIVYDYELNSFRIRLKIAESASQEIKTSVQQKALDAMKNKNVDPDEWGYHFLYSKN